MPDGKTCFVIAPIGEEDSETRERSDTVFGDVIKEVVSDFGYQCKRADQIEEPGSITNQVIEYVVDSELVIADLTDQNPNVFYELAVRHAHHKPVIQLINADQEIPFDIATQRTISINLDDFTTTRDAQEEIRNQIEEIESEEFEVENPVSVAGRIRELRESENPEKRELAEFTEQLNEISANIRSIESELGDPKKMFSEEFLEMLRKSSEEDKIKSYGEDIIWIDRKLKDLYDDIKEEDIDQSETQERISNIGKRVISLKEKLVTDHRNINQF